MIGLFQIMFFTIFGIVVAVFVLTILRGISEWSRNNASPQLTSAATVVAKRTNVSTHSHSDSMMPHSSTSYYVTFELIDGTRMEFPVHGDESLV